jgi:probable HAF family extracellular repeat protein
LALPVRLAAQEQKEEKNEHHHYKMVVIEPLGGPTSTASGPGLVVLNNRGTFAAIANTATPNPNTGCFIPFNTNNTPDCFVEHPVAWHNGEVTDLGVLPGGNNSQTVGMAPNGLITGFSENGQIDPYTGLPEAVAVLWAGKKLIELDNPLHATESMGIAVNSRGQVASIANNDIPDPFSLAASFTGFTTQTRAILWHDGEAKDLGTLGGPDALVNGMNELGQAFGGSYTSSTPNQTTGVPTQDPFFWENGKMWDLGTLGGTQGYASGINNRGQVAGVSNLAGDQTNHAFLWDKAHGLKDLGTLPGGTNSIPNWINDAGEVVGFAENAITLVGFLWEKGVMSDLGTLPGDCNSAALSINSKGQIVGNSSPDCIVDGNAVLWEHGGAPVNLNTLVTPASDVTAVFPVEINDRGEIAAHAFTSTGDQRAVLLIPCDEDHPDIEGCDYDPVDAVTAAQVRSAQITQPSAASSFANLSPAERMTRFRSMMANRNRRFGVPQTAPK